MTGPASEYREAMSEMTDICPERLQFEGGIHSMLYQAARPATSVCRLHETDNDLEAV